MNLLRVSNRRVSVHVSVALAFAIALTLTVLSPGQFKKVRANLEGGTTVQSTWLWGGPSKVTQRYGCTDDFHEDYSPANCTNDIHGIYWHHGLDIADPPGTPNPNVGCYPSGSGTPVFADGPGTVREAGPTTYGSIVRWQRDSDGYQVVLYHAQQILVNQGDRVWAGRQLAQVGNLGISSGCHVHFEIRKPSAGYWDDIDPTPFLGGCGAVIAVQGSGGQMYVCRYGQSGFLPYGGSIQGSPAVAGWKGSPIYVATGRSNGVLYVGSDTYPFDVLVPSNCLDNPGITTDSSLLYVGCWGGGQLYVGQTPIPSSGRPRFAGDLSPAGGRLWAGPAVALMYGAPKYFVIGDTNPNGNLYVTSGNGTWLQMYGWGCSSHVGVSSQWDKAILACNGTDNNVWFATSGNGGGSWTAPRRMTVFPYASIIAGVSVAMTRNGDALVVVQETDYSVYQSYIPWGQEPLNAQNVPSNVGGGTAAAQL